MEVISEFNDQNGFNVKLTVEKIYISALGTEETFALRGIHGVGLYDAIEKFNKELEEYKKNIKGLEMFSKYGGFVSYGIAALLLFQGIKDETIEESIPIAVVLVLAGVFWSKIATILQSKSKHKKPVLDSYFRLMISGGQREFKFDKSNQNSVLIADFINKVEDTLTAYQK